jgi:hypothetical protein
MNRKREGECECTGERKRGSSAFSLGCCPISFVLCYTILSESLDSTPPRDYSVFREVLPVNTPHSIVSARLFHSKRKGGFDLRVGLSKTSKSKRKGERWRGWRRGGNPCPSPLIKPNPQLSTVTLAPPPPPYELLTLTTLS